MSNMEAIAAEAMRMKEQGIRRLLVLSGECDWVYRQAQQLRLTLAGDGIWVGPEAVAEPCCPPSALKTLLGREFLHAFFDAREGFDVAAFAALAGALKAGSWLVLLIPAIDSWSGRADSDSVRWSDSANPIPVPHFIHHFCRTLKDDAEAAIWQQNQPFTLPEAPARPAWHEANGEPQAEQARILAALAAMEPGVAVVTAERGRGKSALAGMHLRRLRGAAIVTAPAKAATDVLAAFAGDAYRFMAPDALLQSTEQADWLIVDEAAAIPGPLLEKLVSRFPRILLTTTVQGYEGTGRGFLLKFCARFPQLNAFSLQQPIRWAAGCSLEHFVSQALLFDDALPAFSTQGALRIEPVEQAEWQSDPQRLQAMYRLLSAAHYRTSPLDLRRMMDAPGQHFWRAHYQEHLAGALWLVEEGGLSPALSQAVWAGFRRPRGNLVAQSLAAHGGSPLAATLRSKRISRIAIHPEHQRQGLGQKMIAGAVAQLRDCDYLSVSFGFTDELWRFWQRCGFQLVRLGTHREASSGCYNAMALYPLTPAGKALVEAEQARLQRNAVWLDKWRELALNTQTSPETMLNESDWLELAGFAFAHRPMMAALGSLNRLLHSAELPMPALRGVLQQQPEAERCQTLKVSGRKALLLVQRQEVANALAYLDAGRSHQLAEQVKKLQFF